MLFVSQETYHIHLSSITITFFNIILHEYVNVSIDVIAANLLSTHKFSHFDRRALFDTRDWQKVNRMSVRSRAILLDVFFYQFPFLSLQ